VKEVFTIQNGITLLVSVSWYQCKAIFPCPSHDFWLTELSHIYKIYHHSFTKCLCVRSLTDIYICHKYNHSFLCGHLLIISWDHFLQKHIKVSAACLTFLGLHFTELHCILRQCVEDKIHKRLTNVLYIKRKISVGKQCELPHHFLPLWEIFVSALKLMLHFLYRIYFQ
jgi:hypothetical protein